MPAASRPLALAILILAALTQPAHPAESPQRPRVYRDRVEPHWLPGGQRFWYRNDLPGGRREFILVDAKAGTRQPAFDHAKAAEAIAKATNNPTPADQLPVDSLDFDGPDAVLLTSRTATWRLDLKTYQVGPAQPKPAAPSAAESLLRNDRVRPSRRTGEATAITFVNRTAAAVEVHWLDTEGERRRYASIEPGETWETNTYDGHVWLVTGAQGATLGVYEATPRRSTAIIASGPATQPATVPTTRPTFEGRRRQRPSADSPDGRWTIAVRDHNLYLRPRASGEEVKLTDDGKPGDAYSSNSIWWSPDSQKLLAFRTVPAQEHKVTIVESSPRDQLQPRLRSFDYLKPGDRLAHPRPQLFHVEGRKRIPIKEDLFPNPWSIDTVRWASDSSRVTFQYNQRGHQVLRLISVDAATGDAKPIIDERSDTFVCYSQKYFCHWVGDSEIIWMSERDGWCHLHLYAARTGQVKNQITRGPWVVQGVAHVDEASRQIWFRASGVRPGQDPYYTHFCRVNFDGSSLAILTEGDGNHTVTWKPGDEYFLDTFSRVDLPPVTELRRADTGQLVCKLEEADASEVLSSRGGRWPQRFTAKARDGQTDIHGVIYFPPDFDPQKKYPVLEQVYAGPQGFFTPKGFRPSYRTQDTFAARGFIVVQADGMGTSGRSKAFHDVCFKNLKDAGFPDRIAWIKAAAKQYPQMDLARVGIYGGSAGGQSAMGALLWHNDFYHVAVADCGCHDNRMDKIWWNEQWMSWPVGKHYEESSNAVNAHLLKGSLMLIVGELDNNVDPASTMQVARALQRANKDFELVVVVGAGHGSAETPYGSRKRADFLTRHLITNARN